MDSHPARVNSYGYFNPSPEQCAGAHRGLTHFVRSQSQKKQTHKFSTSVDRVELERRRLLAYVNEPARAGNFLVDGAGQLNADAKRMLAYVATISDQFNGGGTTKDH